MKNKVLFKKHLVSQKMEQRLIIVRGQPVGRQFCHGLVEGLRASKVNKDGVGERGMMLVSEIVNRVRRAS